MQNAYSLIYGQCSEGICNKLKSMPNFDKTENEGDTVALLMDIKTIMFQFQMAKYMPQAIHECKDKGQ